MGNSFCTRKRGTRARIVVGFGTCWDGWFGWRLVILGDEKLFYLLGSPMLYFGHTWGFGFTLVWFPNQGGKDDHS